MNDFEFYSFIVKNWFIYLIAFAICLFIYYQIYKRIFLSILDPINFNILYSFLGASVVVFLFFIGEINSYYFFSYCLTQLSFTIGFFVFKPISKNNLLLKSEFKIKDELLLLEIIFIISSLFHIASQLFVYSIRGIPLFMQSYLETYNVGGGFGTFSRIINTSSIVSWYFVIHFFINKKGNGLKIYLWIYITLSLIFFVLSGSKTTFLNIGLTLFIYTLINSRFNISILKVRKQIDKFSLFLLIFVFIMVLIIISIKSNGGLNPIVKLGIRLIHSGDAYFYGYPNNVLNGIKEDNPFHALFSDILGMFRIINWEDLPQSFGLKLYRYHNPLITVIAGANARHNIFGLFYFGYFGSIIFSFILGLIVSYLRNRLYFSLPRNTLSGLFYTLFYWCACTIESDICLALFMFNSYFLSFILIFGVSFFIYLIMKKPFLKQSSINERLYEVH